MLRVFGVTVTDYEEKTAAILEQAAAASGDNSEQLRLALAAIELTADLNTRLREMNNHLFDTQTRVLSELKAALGQPQP